MKRRILALALVLSLGLCVVPHALAANDKALITVGGKTVTNSMVLDDVIALFGTPKLMTASSMGGKSCTFYGDNYQDYLYIETFADGTIATYGSISPGFATESGNYGDHVEKYDSRCRQALRHDNGKLWGIICYRLYTSVRIEQFYQNMAENNKNLCMHAVEMWNAVTQLYGYKTPLVFNEQVFNMNQQLADNGSDLYEYCCKTYKSYYFSLSHKGDEGSQFYPNPLAFAEDAMHYSWPSGNYAAFISYPNGSGTYTSLVGSVNPELLQPGVSVTYTQEEQETLEKVRATYQQSISDWNGSSSYYEVEPQYETLPLVSGILSEGKAKGAVGFLNAIRIGAGIEPLAHSRELSEAAQCKSTLTVYISQHRIPNPSPHTPNKPAGVDDTLYKKSQAGNGENLFSTGILSTSVLGSIINALDDTAGVGQKYSRGHRYNLLEPRWETMGVGNTLQQGVHKLDGSGSSTPDVVAWPSKGIMISESGFQASTMLTCRFHNGMVPTDNTVVTIRCLNTGRWWQISKDALTSDQDFAVSGNLISYSDKTLVFAVGNVYTFTFEHLRNTDGKSAEYTYRCVYESASASGGEDEAPDSLTLSSRMVSLRPGQSQKVNAVLQPKDLANMMVTWHSDNPAVAVVNENGIITAKASGTAVITARSEAGGLCQNCTVHVGSEAVENLFDDVPKDAWYAAYALQTAQANLMQGVGRGRFAPLQTLSLAETVTLCARLHASYQGGSVPASTASEPWYQSAYDYCKAKGLLSSGEYPLDSMTAEATRYQMVDLLDRAVPEAEKPVRQARVAVPDVEESDTYGSVVYRWYRAAILIGDEKGHFNGPNSITRAETATILCRLVGLEELDIPVIETTPPPAAPTPSVSVQPTPKPSPSPTPTPSSTPIPTTTPQSPSPSATAKPSLAPSDPAPTPNPPAAPKAELEYTEKTVEVGAQQVFPLSSFVGRTPYSSWVYISSDPEVVYITSDGLYVPRSAGTATLTVSFPGDDDYAVSATITVTNKPNWNPTQPSNLQVSVGGSKTGGVTAMSFGRFVSLAHVAWEADDPTVVGFNWAGGEDGAAKTLCSVKGLRPGTTTVTGTFTFRVEPSTDEVDPFYVEDTVSFEVEVYESS